MRTPIVAAFVGVALTAAGCATSPPAPPEVAPAGAAGTPQVSAPVSLDDAVPVTQRRGAPASRGPSRPTTAVEPTTAPVTADTGPSFADAPAVPAAPAPAPAPAPATATPPTPPDPVVGDDGCVTDRTTGLVVACHDPAAGPDDAPPTG